MRIETATTLRFEKKRVTFEASRISVEMCSEASSSSHVTFCGHASISCGGESLIRALLRTARKRKIVDSLHVRSSFRIDEKSYVGGIRFYVEETHLSLHGGATFRGTLQDVRASGSIGKP